jgi:hypothetical protein
MAINDRNSDRRLSKLLYNALIPRGFRPKTNDEIEAMLETIGGETISDEKRERMLQKIRGEGPIRLRTEQIINFTSEALTEEQKELVELCRAKGEEIPPDIQALLNEMEKRAADLEEEEGKYES